MPHQNLPERPRTVRQRFADLFWIFFVASLGLDVYAISTMQESDFYAAACMGAVSLLCFLVGPDDE